MDYPNEDDFEAKYKPQKNHFDSNASWNGWLYETYGREVEYIFSLPPEKVCTIVDGEDTDEPWIVAGRCFVNRIGYIVTELPWETGDEQFICE